MANNVTVFTRPGVPVSSQKPGARVERQAAPMGNGARVEYAPHPYGESHDRDGRPYGHNPYTLAQRNAEEARQRELEEAARKQADEPRLIATVVELRGNESGDAHASISLGPGNSLDVHAVDDARVGDRVLIDRNRMQILEVIHDDVPTGIIVTAAAIDGKAGIIEAQIGEALKAFRVQPEMLTRKRIEKGHRVIVDPSMTYVIGSLGAPPAPFSFAPKITTAWEDIGGHSEAKAALREAIELPMAHPELFAAYGKRPIRGVLLHGPAGTGKTILAKAAAAAIARVHGESASTGFIYVKGPELLNPYIGKSEEAVRAIFAGARKHRKAAGYPAVVFVDECDALLGVRDRGLNAGVASTVVPQFLAEMDGLEESAAIFILATNRPDTLDPAVTREGRVDRKIRIGRPSATDALTILGLHLRGRPLSGADHAARAVDAAYADSAIVRELGYTNAGDPLPPFRLRDMMSGALLAEVVERASTIAIGRDIAAGARVPIGITEDDLVVAVGFAVAAQRDTNVDEAIADLLGSGPR